MFDRAVLLFQNQKSLIRVNKDLGMRMRNSDQPVNVYLFKVNNRSNMRRYKICSKLTIKTAERRGGFYC